MSSRSSWTFARSSDRGIRAGAFFPATAATRDQLLPIDCIAHASPPFVERLANQRQFMMPTLARSIPPLRRFQWSSNAELALFRAPLHSVTLQCFHLAGSRTAPPSIPTHPLSPRRLPGLLYTRPVPLFQWILLSMNFCMECLGSLLSVRMP